MLYLGSCLALNLSYFGCCVFLISQFCSNNGCYCDENCYIFNDCCNDVADIGCHPTYSSPAFLHTVTNVLGKINSGVPFSYL